MTQRKANEERENKCCERCCDVETNLHHNNHAEIHVEWNLAHRDCQHDHEWIQNVSCECNAVHRDENFGVPEA